jgi:environmental stress-induced protein Ves
MPWKNGGGETIEIAVFPPGADLDAFGWRVSTATVGSDGPFSMFQGVDRTLCVLSGNGISLTVGNGEALVLNRSTEPFSFPADIPAAARRIDGPITGLNVMTRRTGWRHEVRRRHFQTGDVLTLDAATQTIVFCQSGTIAMDDAAGVPLLTSNATLLVDGGGGPCRLCALEPTAAFVIVIDKAET